VPEETITVCGVHRDTVELLDEVRKEMAKNTAEVAKLNTSLGWIKWVVTGVLGATFTLMLAIVPFMSNLHTRITVLEKRERQVYETVERRNIQSVTNDAKSGIVPNDKTVDVGVPVGIR